MGTFKDVVGHKDIIKYIQSAVKEDKVSHAYILNGEKGSGKKMLAKLFATALLCEKGGQDPCGKCHDIREQVNGTVDIKPYQGPYKVYIIPHADTMTVQAQNALLKTIEEPPKYAVILLLTENADMLLATINSRCVMLKLRNIKDALIRKYLMENLEVPDYKADMCTAFAQGNLGRAIMLANSEHFNEIREEALHLLRHIKDMEISEIVEAVSRAAMYKLEITDYLDIIMIWYRDVLLYKATRETEKVVLKDQVNYMKEQAKRSSYEGIEQILASLENAKARLRANVNFDLVMELLFLTIKEN